MNRNLTLICLALIVVAGCNKPPEVVQPGASNTPRATPPDVVKVAPGGSVELKDPSTPAKEPTTTKPTPATKDTANGKPAPAPKAPASPKPGEATLMNPEAKKMFEEMKNRPKQTVNAPKHGDPGWKKTSFNSAEFASRLARSIGGLRNTTAMAKSIVNCPDGGEGHYKSDIKIKDSTAYKIDYVVINKVPYSCSMVANGNKRMVRVKDLWTKPMPANAAFPSDKTQAATLLPAGRPDLTPPTTASSGNALSLWRTEFTRILFQGLTDGSDAIRPFVSTLGQTQKVFVEEKTGPFMGKVYTNYRLLAVNPKDPSQTQEIIVDQKKFLPIMIRSTWKNEKGEKFATLWMCSWEDKAPQASDFKGPYSSAGG